MKSIDQRCTKCLIPVTYPGTTFNESGVCNHCLECKTTELLGADQFIAKIKSKQGNQYDCVLGISGEKDSCYVAYLVKEKYNLRALAVCYDFPFLVDLARQNIKNVCESLNLDLITVNDTFRLIYPGHLSYHHGLDIGIKALAIVKQEVSSIRLDIYAGSWILAYRNFLNVDFCDPENIEELAEIYKRMDIGIVTKRAGIFSSEAFSTKTFDFMASGVPTVASKTKIDEYYFDDSIIMFFESENHEDMAQRIIELHRNTEKRQSRIFNFLWSPALAGMTERAHFSRSH